MSAGRRDAEDPVSINSEIELKNGKKNARRREVRDPSRPSQCCPPLSAVLSYYLNLISMNRFIPDYILRFCNL